MSSEKAKERQLVLQLREKLVDLIDLNKPRLSNFIESKRKEIMDRYYGLFNEIDIKGKIG